MDRVCQLLGVTMLNVFITDSIAVFTQHTCHRPGKTELQTNRGPTSAYKLVKWILIRVAHPSSPSAVLLPNATNPTQTIGGTMGWHA